MGLLEQAKKDTEAINTNLNDWSALQYWTNPGATKTATVKGRHVKHHMGFDLEGKLVRTKNASCSFSEQTMVDAAYPIRNAKGEVDLKNHLVNIVDSTGTLYKYIVEQWLPDETIGMVVCILGAYE